MKICCIAKSKLAKLLCAISKMKEETKRSREQMTEKPEVDNWDEEKQQGGRDKLGTPMLTPPEPHPQTPGSRDEERNPGASREIRCTGWCWRRRATRMAWQSNRESPALPPQEPHLPLQSLLLEERIEEMFKGNQELAGKLRALDGAGGKEQWGWQGMGNVRFKIAPYDRAFQK